MTMRAERAPAPTRLVWGAAALAAALAMAGLIHGVLMPAHFAESTLFGLGFLAAAVAQLGLAALVLIRPGRAVYAAIIAVSLTLMAPYAFNVMVGLPFHEDAGSHSAVGAPADGNADGGHGAHEEADEHGEVTGEAEGHGTAATEADGHGEGGLVLGSGEPVDAAGATTQAAQLAAILLAAWLLTRRESVGSSTTGDLVGAGRRTAAPTPTQ